MTIITVKIAEIRQETPTVKVLKIDLQGQEFNYKAGQWIDCYADIDGERFVVGYSLASSPPAKGYIELAVKTSDNPVTCYVHKKAKAGDLLYIEGGQGSVFYDSGMGDKVVLAGAGIGVAPLMGILRFIDERTTVSVQMFHSASSLEELIYYDELMERSVGNERVSYYPTISKGDSVGGVDHGRISGESFERYGVDYGSLFYLSGPGEMIPDLKKFLVGMGVALDRIRYEVWW
ncbi:MAG: FAD-dependent oxidoreductase [Candidatus Bathyarchaeota archaeon]|nr:FAD-dependent oxidoreductase [Candidatus Bathyarchaeota archaeon]